MTELMKQYEADFEKGLTHECYQSWLETEISDNKRYIATLESKVVMYEYEIKQLKEQLRWRPVSEKPEKKTGQILCKRQVKVNSKEFTRLYPADMCDIEDWVHFVKKLEIVSYLPIPPAPEGE